MHSSETSISPREAFLMMQDRAIKKKKKSLEKKPSRGGDQFPSPGITSGRRRGLGGPPVCPPPTNSSEATRQEGDEREKPRDAEAAAGSDASCGETMRGGNLHCRRGGALSAEGACSVADGAAAIGWRRRRPTNRKAARRGGGGRPPVSLPSARRPTDRRANRQS